MFRGPKSYGQFWTWANRVAPHIWGLNRSFAFTGNALARAIAATFARRKT
jgi:hypothetical protein